MTDEHKQTNTTPEHAPEEPKAPAAAKTVRELRAEHDAAGGAAAMPRPVTMSILPRASSSTTTEVFGRTLNLNIYDVVFISLGIFTLLEVAIAELLPHGTIAITILLALTLVKAFHVVWYYMHLNHDSRIFWLSLLIPAFIAVLGMLYLAAVPPTGY